MLQRRRKALIIGAGIAGPVAAILLKRAGFDAELFEAWPYSTETIEKWRLLGRARNFSFRSSTSWSTSSRS